MQALANFIMRGPVQAILMTALFALISLIPILGFVSMFSGAALALATLRAGPRQGLIVMVGATVMCALLLSFVPGGFMIAVLYAACLWLPLWLLAQVLRKTISWSLTLETAIGIGFIGLMVAHVMLGDTAQFWQQLMKQVFELMEQQGQAVIGFAPEQIVELSRWVTAVLAGSLVLGMVMCLMLARWWQSLLYHPGGFRDEFYGLRLSKISAVATLLVLVLATIGGGGLAAYAGDAMAVLLVVYSFVGLALVHAYVAMKQKHVGWLVGLYVLGFIFLPQVMVVLAALGFSDSWWNFRERFAVEAKSTNSDRDEM